MNYKEQINSSKQSYPPTQLRQHPRMMVLGEGAKTLLFVVFHVGLGLIIRRYPLLSTIHAYSIFLVGIWKAINASKTYDVAPIIGYIVGAEILWRMTSANIFWEFSKYASVLIFILVMIKTGKIEKAGLPLLYFLLLLPSILLIVDSSGFSGSLREEISFNLSGPLAISICIIAFRQVKINISELRTLLWAIAYPIISIFTMAAYDTLTASEIRFSGDSVFITSGGYGPNQVSSILGLATMLLIFIAIIEEKPGRRTLILAFSLAMMTQTILTFARGGLFNILIALPLALIHLLKNPTKFVKSLFLSLVIFVIAFFIILPKLTVFTGGAVEARFTSFDTTGRSEIAQADLRLWKQHPFMGVGPGQSQYLRDFRYVVAPHTEFSRMLAEHGLFGLLSLLILSILMAQNYVSNNEAFSKSFIVAFTVWPVLQMSHSGMRLASTSFILGLAFAGWQLGEMKSPKLSSKKNLNPTYPRKV